MTSHYIETGKNSMCSQVNHDFFNSFDVLCFTILLLKIKIEFQDIQSENIVHIIIKYYNIKRNIIC